MQGMDFPDVEKNTEVQMLSDQPHWQPFTR